MPYEIEYADEFFAWWQDLTAAEQASVKYVVDLLAQSGPALARPFADTVNDSRFANMKELRVQHEGRPYRVFFAFDPRRAAMLLIGGDKTGDKRFYVKFIPIADAIFTEHLRELARESH